MSTKANTIVEQLIEKISAAVPPGLIDFQEDFKEQLRGFIGKAFNECGIVTQEEFDAYRHAVEQMQKRVKALEKQVNMLKDKT